MEAAVWCVLCLPLLLLGVSMYALAHDGNIVQVLPESLGRETPGGIITWRSDGDQGFFDVDEGRLESIVEGLGDRAFVALQQSALKLEDISARSCYWVYEVDPNTGVVTDVPIMSDCRSQGVLGDTLDLEVSRLSRFRKGISKPIVTEGVVAGFVSRVVLIGIAVGGRYQGLAEYLRDEVVQHGAVWVPREDVRL